jgi:hypothetical protein
VIVAIAGNAVENVVGIQLAWKRRYDLAISVVKNSVAQIAAFLYPVLVLISMFFTQHLTFGLPNNGLVLVVALVFAALAIWQITGDGEAAPYEGLALVATYALARYGRVVRMIESVWGYPRPPRVEPSNRRIRVVLGGETIVDTARRLPVFSRRVTRPSSTCPLDEVADGVLSPSAGGRRSASGREPRRTTTCARRT